MVITMFEFDGVDMTDGVKTTDDQTFLVTLENVALGDHTAKTHAMDVAGNTLEDVLEIDFEVSDRDPFERRLNGGQLNRQAAVNVWLVRHRNKYSPSSERLEGGFFLSVEMGYCGG